MSPNATPHVELPSGNRTGFRTRIFEFPVAEITEDGFRSGYCRSGTSLLMCPGRWSGDKQVLPTVVVEVRIPFPIRHLEVSRASPLLTVRSAKSPCHDYRHRKCSNSTRCPDVGRPSVHIAEIETIAETRTFARRPRPQFATSSNRFRRYVKKKVRVVSLAIKGRPRSVAVVVGKGQHSCLQIAMRSGSSDTSVKVRRRYFGTEYCELERIQGWQ